MVDDVRVKYILDPFLRVFLGIYGSPIKIFIENIKYFPSTNEDFMSPLHCYCLCDLKHDENNYYDELFSQKGSNSKSFASLIKTSRDLINYLNYVYAKFKVLQWKSLIVHYQQNVTLK